MKLKNITRFIPYSPFVFAFIFISRLLSPFVLIRFGVINSERLGHFISNTEVYLLNKLHHIDQPKINTLDIWCFDERICNKALESIFRKKLNIGPKTIIKYAVLINQKIDPNSKYVINHYPRDINSLRSISPAIFELSNYQVNKAKLELNKFGISDNDKYIALVVRDQFYLDTLNDQVNWEYHNYRNCNIENYLLAAESLADEGYYVLRMGKFVDKKLKSKNHKIIDYASSPWRSDLLDIYIGANCEFCISSGTGFDLIPAMFRRPIVYTDQAPIGIFPSYMPNSIAIFKQYYSLEKERKLSLSEIIERNAHYFLKTQKFKDARIKLIENTPKEIKDLCFEMIQRINLNWKDKNHDKKLQDQFWLKFFSMSHSQTNKKSICRHNKVVSRVGASFLRENTYLIN